jgi:hypothetical protein
MRGRPEKEDPDIASLIRATGWKHPAYKGNADVSVVEKANK